MEVLIIRVHVAIESFRNHLTSRAIVFTVRQNDTPESGNMLEFQLYKGSACDITFRSVPHLAQVQGREWDWPSELFRAPSSQFLPLPHSLL